MEQRVLLCTTAGELPTWGFNESLTDAQSQRFTRGQDIFTSTGHVHCHALHILAQNITWPAKILEYPTWKDIEKELQKIIEQVIAENERVVADYCAGKGAALQFLIGQGMKATKGSANPEILKKLLAEKMQ